MNNLLIYFITGGLFTTLIIALEESGSRTLSGFMALIPVFTLVSYIFIGPSQGGFAVSQHAKFVLFGTFAAWVPYMIAVIYLAPKLGALKATVVGMLLFFVLAGIYIYFINRFGFFQ
ncbi:MAG TPA: hypothetical protein VJ579_02840 [Candidatus Paceibacterota bacterium]|nr:hypothetical protein [Candidatus Paceibacterota bacterium]